MTALAVILAPAHGQPAADGAWRPLHNPRAISIGQADFNATNRLGTSRDAGGRSRVTRRGVAAEGGQP